MLYTSLEQRVAASYLDVFPSFVPVEHADVSPAEQRKFYDLMRRVFQLQFDDPLLLVPSLHEDDSFPSRYKSAKPQLQANMLKYQKAVKTLLNQLFLMGRGNPVKWNKRQKHFLSVLGFDPSQPLPAAWTWMSTRPGADPVAFAYCLFDRNYVYSSEVYAHLLGESAFRKLENWMISKGYQAYDIYNTTWVDYRLSLKYVNPAWGREPPVNGGFEYKIQHTGIAVQYDACVRNPVTWGICIPGIQFFLKQFRFMEPALQEFVLEHTKRCSGCRYCVQTDRTGTRPLACISLFCKNTNHMLCPYFPGYTYSWTHIDDSLVEMAAAFLDFMDRFSGEKAPLKKI